MRVKNASMNCILYRLRFVIKFNSISGNLASNAARIRKKFKYQLNLGNIFVKTA
jgi:hypothetical protein